jgi:hypothetical protein
VTCSCNSISTNILPDGLFLFSVTNDQRGLIILDIMLLKTKCLAEQDFTELDYSSNFEGHTEATGNVTELVYLLAL